MRLMYLGCRESREVLAVVGGHQHSGLSMLLIQFSINNHCVWYRYGDWANYC